MSKHESEYYRSMADWDDSSTRSWNAIADDWVRHADKNDYCNDLLMPSMLELLGDVRGTNSHSAAAREAESHSLFSFHDVGENYLWIAYETLKNSERSSFARSLFAVSSRSSPYPTKSTVCQLSL
jgi:hypothetical protein